LGKRRKKAPDKCLVKTYEAPTRRLNHASPFRRRTGHGHLSEAHTTRCRTLLFGPDTAFSLDAEKIRCGAAKSGTWTPVTELPVAELPVAELPPNSRRGEGKIEDRKGKVKQNKNKNLKRKHNHILINLII